MGIRIHPIEGPTDPRFGAFADSYRADWAEREPSDPVAPDSVVAVEAFGNAPDVVRLVVLAEADGETAGHGIATTKRTTPGSPRVAELDVYVTVGHRRRGIGTAVLADLVAALRDLGQESIMGFPCLDTWPVEGPAMCRRFGLTPRQEERCSRLVVAEADDAAIARWLADGPASAAGYRIAQWEGVCPPALAEAWQAADGAILDAPLDDLDYAPTMRTVEAQRDADERDRANGIRMYRTLVLSPDGEGAGATVIYLNESYPEVAYQGNTSVRSEHRGRRLGRWLKAANYRQALDAAPAIRVVETYNAESNPWMLDINVAMGFRPHHTYVAHQAPIEVVVAALDRSASA